MGDILLKNLDLLDPRRDDLGLLQDQGAHLAAIMKDGA